MHTLIKVYIVPISYIFINTTYIHTQILFELTLQLSNKYINTHINIYISTVYLSKYAILSKRKKNCLRLFMHTNNN